MYHRDMRQSVKKKERKPEAPHWLEVWLVGGRLRGIFVGIGYPDGREEGFRETESGFEGNVEGISCAGAGAGAIATHDTTVLTEEEEV